MKKIAIVALASALHFAGFAIVSAFAESQREKAMVEEQNSLSKSTGKISIAAPWVRMSFGKAINSAGFMTIKNSGDKNDMLIGASTPISQKTELHTHIMDGDIMRMRRVEGGIAVPKGGHAELKPGGFHIMFIGLHKPLKKGDRFPLTLIFKQAGEVKLSITSQKKALPGGMMDHSKMDHSKMDHSKMDHSKMDHSKMDHSKMDHSKMKMDMKK